MEESLIFLSVALFATFILAKPTIWLLKFLKITRKDDADPTGVMAERSLKQGVPMAGGILIVSVIFSITFFFNWNRENTFFPIGILLVSSLTGTVDDLLSAWQLKRRTRNLKMTLKLIKVHKNIFYRIWLFFTLPWQVYKRIFFAFGSTAKGRGVFPHEKIILQVVASGILAWWMSFKLEWTSINIPFLGAIDVGPWIMIPLIIFIVLFMTNAVNITDGLDGLSGGLLTIVFIAYMFIAWQKGFQSIADLLGTIVGTLIAYLWFNIKPAKLQMGDSGSLGLGALLTAIAFALDEVYLLFVFGGVFIIEIISVIIQVAWKTVFGKRLFRLTPLHHHLEYKGIKEETIVMKFWLVGIILVFVGLLIMKIR